MPDTLPVMIFTGFLGAGKTTLINKILDHPGFGDTLVIVNEFGAVPLDHLLLKQSGEPVLELANGCVCCSVRGELVDALVGIEHERYSRVFIETTGIADPLPIMQSLAVHPGLISRFHLHSLTSVYDCSQGNRLLRRFPEARRQIGLADHVFLTRGEGLKDNPLSNAFAYANYNANADTYSNINLSEFLQKLRSPKITVAPKIDVEAVPENHAAAFETIVLEIEQSQSIRDIDKFVRHLADRFGSSLLRLKGIARIPNRPEKLVIIQMSAGVLHHPMEIDQPMSSGPGLQLVTIAEREIIQDVQDAFESFSQTPGIDLPDREALLENPLSIPGFNSNRN